MFRMKKQAILAFDLGATSGRAVLGMFDGKRLVMEEVHRFPNQPVMLGQTLCWDFPRLFFEIKQGIHKAKKKAGKIQSLGIDSWGVDFGLIDEAGRLLSNPVHYRDRRNQGVMEKVFELVPKQELFQMTGLQFLPFNTIFQLYALKLSNSFELKCASQMLMMPDLFNFFLAGSRTSEFTHCSTSQLLSPHTRNWNKDLIARLELPSRIFPEIIPPGTVIGRLRQELIDEFGLPETRLIAVAEHDTASAVASVPAHGKNWAYLSSGTWFLLGVETARPVINDQSFQYLFANEGGVFGSWRLLKNITGFWLLEQARACFEQKAGKPVSYPALLKEAEKARPGIALIDVDAPEFLNPPQMVTAIQDHCRKSGQKIPRTRGEIVRVIFESLIARCRTVLGQLEQLTGEKLARLHIVGGGARNHLFCRWLARGLDREVVAGPEEATALGNLCMQLIAEGELGSHAEARELVARSVRLRYFSA
jgi:rhamnulokinase